MVGQDYVCLQRTNETQLPIFGKEGQDNNFRNERMEHGW